MKYRCICVLTHIPFTHFVSFIRKKERGREEGGKVRGKGKGREGEEEDERKTERDRGTERRTGRKRNQKDITQLLPSSLLLSLNRSI